MTTAKLPDAKRALLADRLRRARTAHAETPGTIERCADDAEPILSYAQERLWFMDQLVPGSTAYTVPVVLRLRGPVDAEAMAAALTEVCRRHETLRMRFPATDDGRPRIVVDPPKPVPLPTIAVDGDERAVETAVRTELAFPFDLTTEPPIRACLVRIATYDHLLVLDVHHIAIDGWSTDVLVADLLRAYRTGEPLAEPAVRYRDFAAWQRATQGSAPARRDLDYWRRELATVPPLELPTDRPRPAEQTFAGDTHRFHVDAPLTDAIREFARGHGATLYMTLLAGYAALLGRYARQDDFAIGSPIAGRTRPEIEGLVGMFTNVLAMRMRLADDPTFTDLVAQVRGTALNAYEHQDTPFEHIVTELNVPRDVSRPPVFSVTLAMQNYARAGSAAEAEGHGLDVGWFTMEPESTRFDLELYVFEAESGLDCLFVYNTDLFDADRIAGFAERLPTLLAAALAAPDTPVSRLALADPQAELPAATGATAPIPAEPLHAAIEAQAAARPDASALVTDTVTLTYRQCNEQANRLAHRLRATGIGPGDVVAVCVERSIELAVALLAVLKSGAAYLPLDPGHPRERLRYLLADSGAGTLLCRRGHANLAEPDSEPTRAPGGAGAAGTKDGPGSASADGAMPLLLVDEPEAWADQPATNPEWTGDPNTPAYLIYTSGSTGRPKGVLNAHRAVVNRLDWMQRAYPIGPDDAVLQKTPASFDVSVWEFFWPLRTGARLVLAAPDGHKDPAYLRTAIDRHRVSVAHFVPSMLAAYLADDAAAGPTSLRRVVCSGEELPVAVARGFLARYPDTALSNLYGPTEAAIDVLAADCTTESLAGRSRVPLGTPIDNVTVHVLDPAGAPCPAGLPGELYLGGAAPALGYLDRPRLTAERFVPDPYGAPGSRLYRTGDLGVRTADGAIEFLGRLDDQVKLRGLRIELGEIAAVLRDAPGVRDAAVVVREDRPGDQRLVGYLVGDADPAQLRTALGTMLPDYMVPATLVPVPALPVTANGKLDRAALPAPAAPSPGAASGPPATDTERAVHDVWAAVLGVETIGVEDDFFDVGGHSLLATQVVARLRTALPDRPRVGVLDVFKHKTIRALAALLDGDTDRSNQLLHELTPAGPATITYVCVPYGGGSAIVYQPLADALPAGHALYALAIPGHDVGLDQDSMPFDELVDACVTEIRERITGPLVLYGHCGVGGALTVALARALHAVRRPLTAVYIGAIFPFAQPRGVLRTLSRVAAMDRLSADRNHENWLKSMGVSMDDLDPDQSRRIIRNMRHDSRSAEEYFTGLLDTDGELASLGAPVVAVVGDQDPATEFFAERYTEWQFLTDTTAAVVLDQAGHFFLKYRATELAEILTRVHPAIEAGATAPLAQPARGPADGWYLEGVASRADTPPARRAVKPDLRRFVAVAAGQLVSLLGSSLTSWAIPIFVYLATGSLSKLGLLGVLGLVPGLLVSPLAGAIVDRVNRRVVMLAGDGTAMAIQLALGILVWSGHLHLWALYPLLSLLSVAATFQRLAFSAALPQLVPKAYLGHATGITQLATGVAQLLVPLVAAGLLAAIQLGGILVIDVVSYLAAIGVVLVVRFPATLGWRRRETLVRDIAHGFTYVWHHRGFRAMLAMFALFNLFLAAPMMLISPLVLTVGDIGTVGRVSFASAIGGVLGALLMTAWGGPSTRRMRGVQVAMLLLAASCMVTALRPSAWLIGAGVAGLALTLTVVNGIYLTIIQVKVPQRFHGRVFAINQLVAWSTLPIGFGLLVPLAVRLVEPLMTKHGALAGSAGVLLGTGPGRGIALVYLLAGVAMALLAGGAMVVRRLARFDELVPDAVPDDLVGAQERDTVAAPPARAAA
ncbi:amino acid adenylation domain-containing protein [Actinocatenispora sera]|uniref:non-ribosomal peptide synthetase/MFS transporter n=1 Tax=Actinocatenispora sera TaxID=390989 RepID=UPI0033D6DB94